MTKIEVPDAQIDALLDEILRQIVCDCGNYRHHGVHWMPEGSTEGHNVARGLLRAFLIVTTQGAVR